MAIQASQTCKPMQGAACQFLETLAMPCLAVKHAKPQLKTWLASSTCSSRRKNQLHREFVIPCRMSIVQGDSGAVCPSVALAFYYDVNLQASYHYLLT